jgi:hypothetical protein
VVPVSLLIVAQARSGSASAQDEARSSPGPRPDWINLPAVEAQANPEHAAEVDSLITRLDSPRYKEREEATRRLTDLGPTALPGLRDAHGKIENLEARLRIESIVRSIYMDYHVYGRQGFLGVSLQPFGLDPQRRARVPPNTTGIELREIIKDTAAQRAGLQKYDVIVAVDGEFLEAAGLASVEAFSTAIRSRLPGTPMTLTVLREGQSLDIKVTMGRCPPQVVRNGNVPPIQSAVRQAEEQFPVWWATQFSRRAPLPDVGVKP